MDESVLEEKSTLKLSYVYTSLQSDTRPIYHFKVILAQSNVANLSLFYRFYFGQCYTEIVELVPFPLSDSQSTRYVNKQQLEYGILYLHIALLCGTSKFLKGNVSRHLVSLTLLFSHVKKLYIYTKLTNKYHSQTTHQSDHLHIYIYIYIYKFTSKCHSQTTPSLERR